jgi:hypothetical protein
MVILRSSPGVKYLIHSIRRICAMTEIAYIMDELIPDD